FYSNEIVRRLCALSAVAHWCDCANHARPFAEGESRRQGNARFCASFCTRSDSRRFHGGFVKARSGEGEHHTAGAEDVGRAGKEIGRYRLVAERARLIAHARLTG